MKLRLLLCLAFAWLSAAAQTVQPRSVAIRAFGFEAQVADLFVSQGNAPVPVTVQPFEVGPVVQADVREGRVEFLREITDERGAKRLRRVAAFTAPAKIDAFVVGLVPQVPTPENGGDAYRVLVYPEDRDSFPANTVRFINLSPFPLAMRLGDEDKQLAPGATDVISPRLDSQHRLYAQIAARAPSGEWGVFHRGPLGVRPDWRATWLIAYSVALPAARGEEPAKTADGRALPQLVLVKWKDYLRPPAPPASAPLVSAR